MILFFLPFIILFGVLSSYSDIKYGKIFNKHIIIFLLIGFILNLLLVSFYYFKNTPINYAYLIELFVSSCLSLVIGVLLWLIGFWTPGDAKLFFTYSLLIPLSVYNIGYIFYFPQFSLLVNTFVPLFIFMFFKLIFGSSKDDKFKALKNLFNLKELVFLFIALFSFSWIIAIFERNFLFNLFILFLIIFLLRKYFKVFLIIVSFLFFVLRLIFDKSIYNLGFLENFLIFYLIFVLIKFILDLSFEFFTKEISVNQLKPGMFLAERVFKEKGKIKKERKFFSFFNLDNSFLDDKLIDEIKSKDIKKIKVYETVPFAPFMFFGVILTLLVKGNIFYFLDIFI